MGCDARNVGAYDLSLGVDYLRKKEKSAKFPFISANIMDSHGKNIFTPYLMKTVNGVKIGIFGLCDSRLKLKKIPGGNKIKLVDPMSKAEEVADLLRKKGADYVVLLTTLDIRNCRRIAQREMPIDLIVGSSKRNRISLPILVHETYIVHVERGGKSVGRLDVSFLGPAGLEALPAAVRFKGKTVGDRFLLNHFFPLRLDIPDHQEIGPLVKKVEAQLTRLQQMKGNTVMAASKAPKPILKSGNYYVFAEACRECHPQRYELWLKSPHSRAYKALVEQKKYYDEECIGCHTLAYEKPGGFSNVREVGDFANVQCESCHGPGYLHIKSQGREKLNKELDGGKLCLECHIEDKSPDFEIETYFKQMCRKPLKEKQK
jgi:predicted CXXCH cytochrome family protein